MKLFVTLITLIFYFFVSAAHSGNRLPTDLVRVGSTKFSVFWFNIYHAELFTDTGDYAHLGDQLILVNIVYQRDIKKQDLLDETLEQWEDFGLTGEQTNAWITQLNTIWPDVKENDCISFYIDANQFTYFYFNQNFIGRIDSSDFSVAFQRIWLDENGSYPKHTRELIGKSKKRS